MGRKGLIEAEKMKSKVCSRLIWLVPFAKYAAQCIFSMALVGEVAKSIAF